MSQLKIGISTCLTGENVRYDGGNRLDRFLADTLGQFVEWVPVCPEAECGLGIPREAMRLIGTPEAHRLMTIHTGIDHTPRMEAWIEARLKELAGARLCGFVFKARSPSSGMQGVKIYDPKGFPRYKRAGLFAAAFMRRFPMVPVEDDGRLHDPVLRENFIERSFTLDRWLTYREKDNSRRGLVEFQARHKLLVMAHSISHMRELGRMTAAVGRRDGDRLKEDYLEVLMEGLRLRATERKHTNVLQHIMGYFKKDLSGDEKQELLDVINRYHDRQVPLIVPVTLLNHYVRKYSNEYLSGQYYLNPHPLELMLRNHC